MAGNDGNGLYNLIFKKKYPNWIYGILFAVYILVIAFWVMSRT